MSRYAEGTTVSVEKTRAEIETTVRRYGADGFISGWEDRQAMVQFRCQNRYVKFVMTLPDQKDWKFTHHSRGMRTPEAAHKEWEQACRQLWRALALMIKAKLEAVEGGIVTFESEFLGHVVMPDGKTVYEHIRGPLALAYEQGSVQPMLPAP